MSNIEIRLAAFQWLNEQVNIYGDVLTRNVLQSGFIYNQQRVPLVAPNGIFKPKIMELPLSITSISNGPYDDREENGFILYKYRGEDPLHRDNVGLRKIMENNIPLVYLRAIMPNKYLCEWPAFIVGDLMDQLTFKVSFDKLKYFTNESNEVLKVSESIEPRREYITTTVKKRLHQKSFRERVLSAYKTQCSLCKLKHKKLLDAAHIIPDSEDGSKPTVDNGISLCKIHHAAYDNFFIGISPDYKIIVREDLLEEINGPMLEHGIKELHNNSIRLPRQNHLKPNRRYLDFRYQKFLNQL